MNSLKLFPKKWFILIFFLISAVFLFRYLFLSKTPLTPLHLKPLSGPYTNVKIFCDDLTKELEETGGPYSLNEGVICKTPNTNFFKAADPKNFIQLKTPYLGVSLIPLWDGLNANLFARIGLKTKDGWFFIPQDLQLSALSPKYANAQIVQVNQIGSSILEIMIESEDGLNQRTWANPPTKDDYDENDTVTAVIYCQYRPKIKKPYCSPPLTRSYKKEILFQNKLPDFDLKINKQCTTQVMNKDVSTKTFRAQLNFKINTKGILIVQAPNSCFGEPDLSIYFKDIHPGRYRLGPQN